MGDFPRVLKCKDSIFPQRHRWGLYRIHHIHHSVGCPCSNTSFAGAESALTSCKTPFCNFMQCRANVSEAALTHRGKTPQTPLLPVILLVLSPSLICLPNISSGFHQGFLLPGCWSNGLEAPGALAGARWHLLTEARSASGWAWREGRSRLPWEAVKSPSLEMLKTQLDMALGSLLKVALFEQGGWQDDFRRSIPTSTFPWLCEEKREEKKKGRREGEEGQGFWLPSGQEEQNIKKEALPTSHLMSISHVQPHKLQIQSRKSDIPICTHSLDPFCNSRASVSAPFLLKACLVQSCPFTPLVIYPMRGVLCSQALQAKDTFSKSLALSIPVRQEKYCFILYIMADTQMVQLTAGITNKSFNI